MSAFESIEWMSCGVSRGGSTTTAALTLLVEHMPCWWYVLSMANRYFAEIGARFIQPAHRRERATEELRLKPRTRLSGFREENLNLLPRAFRGCVALILIVVQPRVIPDLLRELSEVFPETNAFRQTFRPLRQRATSSA